MRMQEHTRQFRSQLLRWMSAGLDAVNPDPAVAHALGDRSWPRVAVLALGKAAIAMMRGAEHALGERIASALLIAPDVSGTRFSPNCKLLRGNHPLPGAESLVAGQAIDTWLQEINDDLPLLVLLSGGGSALAELPVPGMTLDDLRRMNRWLLGSGFDIHDINAARGRFSRLKRGGLLRLAGQRDVLGLLASDVPEDDAADIASGPLSPRAVRWPEKTMPHWLEALHADLPQPSVDVPASRAELCVIVRNDDALDAIEAAAMQDGFTVLSREALSGAADVAGAVIGKRLRDSAPGVHLFGGETVVHLPDHPGRGGRNQHLALAVAREIAECENILLLSFGTDGVDGNTHDAGAIVDGGTWHRIRDAGLEPEKYLSAMDSNTALAAAGDLVHTGPTGTNVMDVVIALKLA